MAKAAGPAPRSREVRVALVTAPLAGSGALLESVASGGEQECRAVWRLRAGSLDRLAVREGSGRPLPDCAPAGQWSYRWEQKEPERPARYLRERTRPVAQGNLREVEAFSFAGFSLEADSGASLAEINGVAIPDWYATTLYTRAALEVVHSRFDLASFRPEPRLRVETDRAEGVLALRWSDPGGQMRLPVTARSLDPKTKEVILEASDGSSSATVRLRLSRDGHVPTEARSRGLGPRFDRTYVPASRLEAGAVQVFATAADELASGQLTGTWQTAKGEDLRVRLVAGPPYRLRFGEALVELDLDGAPEGTDLLLVPADGSDPRWAVVLRGPDVMARVPVECRADGDRSTRSCRTTGPLEALQRVGARLNLGAALRCTEETISTNLRLTVGRQSLYA